MTKQRYHKPIGKSETHKGLSLSVSDLLRKTSAQNIENLELNSKLVDMFKQGLSEVEEDRLLDFLPLRTSRYRDLTDIEAAREEARMYVRSQFEEYQKSKLAQEQRRRAAFVARQRAAVAAAAVQKQSAGQVDYLATPAADRVATPKTKPVID